MKKEHPYLSTKNGNMIVSYETNHVPKISGLAFDFNEEKGLHDLYVNGRPGKFEDFVESGFTEETGLKYGIGELEFETYQLLLMQNLSKYALRYLQKSPASETPMAI